ncbi:MAG: hypothetical protein LBT79_03970 [Elusimicrobiota bacterium]|nr:hypothetical protein [Elusimicrobiota bacterium]
MTIISAPLLISNFINDVIAKTERHGSIDVKLITAVIQKFSKSRGMCILSNRELVKDLTPYLQNR